MAVHHFPLALHLPEGAPELIEIDQLARALHLTRDQYISRCVIAHTATIVAQLSEPSTRDWIAAGQGVQMEKREIEPLEPEN